MHARSFTLFLLSLLPSLTLVAEEKEVAKAEKPKFVRVVRDDKEKPLTLETAIVTYVPVDPAKTDIRVELVGAVHVGEKDYYAALNKEFEQYDALLYELVAREGNTVPKEREGKGAGSAPP